MICAKAFNRKDTKSDALQAHREDFNLNLVTVKYSDTLFEKNVRYFAPRIHKMFTAFRSANPNIKLALHSCGSIIPIIPKFIDLGLDFMNPLQPLAKEMDAENIKKNFEGKIGFFGATVYRIYYQTEVQNILNPK